MPYVPIAVWSELADRAPIHVAVDAIDLVVVRLGDTVSVLYGRCTHRGALLAQASVVGDSLVCAAHAWDYECATGRSRQVEGEAVARFASRIDHAGDAVLVDRDEILAWRAAHLDEWHADEHLSLP